MTSNKRIIIYFGLRLSAASFKTVCGLVALRFGFENLARTLRLIIVADYVPQVHSVE